MTSASRIHKRKKLGNRSVAPSGRFEVVARECFIDSLEEITEAA